VAVDSISYWVAAVEEVRSMAEVANPSCFVKSGKLAVSQGSARMRQSL
jgi:hypothetical protein